MPNVVDALVVTLNLDSSKFSGDAGKALAIADKTAKDVQSRSAEIEKKLAKTHEDSNKRLKQSQETLRGSSEGVQRFQAQVTGALAVLATGFGLTQFIQNMTKTEAQMGRTARNIGIGVGELNAWQEAAKRTGGSAEGVTASFQYMSQELENIRLTGHSEVQQWAANLKVSLADAEGNARKIPDIFRDINKALANKSPAEQVNWANRFHIDPGMLGLMQSGPAELERLLAHVGRLGLMTPKQVADAIAFDNAIKDLEQTLTGFARVVLDAALPSIEHFINLMTVWASKPENKKFISETVVQGIKDFGDQVTNIIDKFNEWKDIAQWIAEFIAVRWVLGMMTGLGPVGIAIAALAAGWLALRKAMEPQDPKTWSADSPLWQTMNKREQLQYPQSPETRAAAGQQNLNPNQFSAWNPGSAGWATWLGGRLGISAGDNRQASVRDALASDLQIPQQAAAGIVSNLNAESGIRGINEINPTVPGSRGGFGWAQWTASRRVDFERWASQNNLDVASDQANYGFLVNELKGKYPQVLQQLRNGSITAQQAADIVARQYIVPPDSTLPAHVNDAERVARLPAAGNPGIGPRAVVPDAGIHPMDWLRNARDHLFGAERQNAAPSVSTNTSSNETNINGPINIHTQATNANEIAASIGPALRRHSYVNQANTGLQ